MILNTYRKKHYLLHFSRYRISKRFYPIFSKTQGKGIISAFLQLYKNISSKKYLYISKAIMTFQKNIFQKYNNKHILSKKDTYNDLKIIKNVLEKNIPLLLPEPEPEYLQHIPLATLSIPLRLLLKTDINVYKTYASFFLLEHTKILYILFNRNLSEIEIFDAIMDCLSLTLSKSQLKNDPLLEEYTYSYLTSIVQHIVNILFYKKTFLVSVLKENNIDFSDYKKLPVSVIIEFIIYKRITQNTSLKDKPYNIKFIDHKHHMLTEKTNMFKQEESMSQTQQRNSDIFFYKFLCDLQQDVVIEKVYRDIKADYRGSATGHLTLMPGVSTEKKIALKYTNNNISLLKAKQKKLIDNNEKSIIQNEIELLTEIHKNISLSKGPIKKLFFQFNDELLRLSLDPNIIKMGINFTVAADIDNYSDVVFQQVILPQIIVNIENNYDIFDPNIFFPQTNKINKLEYLKKVEEIIKQILPKEVQEHIRENLYKAIKDE